MDRGMEIRATARNRAKVRACGKQYGKEWPGETSLRFQYHLSAYPDYYGRRPTA